MELLKLNLLKPLEWYRVEAAEMPGAGAAVIAMETATEGAEAAVYWNWNQMVEENGDDGPRVRRPLAPPELIAASGLDAALPSAAAVSLEAGRYLFFQTRKPAETAGMPATEGWLAGLIESYVREALWTDAKTSGSLIVRFVREDRKTAVQVLRKME